MNHQLSLKRRSFNASAWAGGGHALGQVIRLAGNLVLTRFLMPEAFGLMAVVFTVLLALGLLSDIGSGMVVVQSKRGSEEEFLHTAWTLQVIRGVGIWLLGLLIAFGLWIGQANAWFAAGTAYADPRLSWLLAVATFGLVIHGLASINSKVAERNLDLKTVSLIELAVQVISLFTMVVTAVLTQSIWALVLGGLVTATLQCVMTHVFIKGPRSCFRLERAAVRELLGKGKWVLVSSLLGFVAVNGDRMLLGGLVDSATLGLYSIAFGLASIGPSAFSAILAKVIFPAFSEVVRARPSELGATYRKFQQIADACIGFLAGFLFVASDAVVRLLYDPRYYDAGHIFGILAIGSIGVRFLVVEQIYVAVGRPSLLAAAILPRVIVVLLGVPLGYSLGGLNGALAAIVLSQFVHWPIAIWFRYQQKLNHFVNDIFLPVAFLGGGAIAWMLVRLLSLISS